MQTLNITEFQPAPSRIALGCMTFGKTWDGQAPSHEILPRATEALEAAVKGGINFFDHADIYCAGRSEEIFGEALRELALPRESLWVQTKCGIRFPDTPDKGMPHRFDYSYAHIMASVEGSLKRMGLTYIDSLCLHRPDALVEPEEVARAFTELQTSGKVRHFGVSNHTAGQIELLCQAVEQPIRFNQIEFSLLHTQIMDEGVDFNRHFESPPTRNHGALEYCRLKGITIQPWSPLAQGVFSGRDDDSADQARQEAIRVVKEMAQKYGVSREAILVAWILRHPAQMQPIIGTTNPERIKAACQADDVRLSREDWYRLWQAGRGRKLP